MPIVQHCTPFSYSLLPSYPLLPAPAARLMLAAPQISGLICPPAPKKVETIIVEQYTSRDLLLEELDPLGCIEDMDYRLEQLYAESHERRRRLREALEARLVEKRRKRQDARQEWLKL